MKHDTITAAELARNLARIIDRVRLSGKSLYVIRGRQTIAELKPPPKRGFPCSQLPELLASLPKVGDEAKAMEEDLTHIRATSDLPENPWD